MDSITARFREIFKRGLYEYAAVKLNREVDENADVETLQQVLRDDEYIFKETIDPPLLMAIALTEALEESDADRVMVRQKGYEIYQNLKRDHSIDHRINIIAGALPLRSLVTLDSKELAPDSVKRRRKEEEQKYLKEQVIIPSHSGNDETHLSDNHQTPPPSPHGSRPTPPPEVIYARDKIMLPTNASSLEALTAPGLELMENWNLSEWKELTKFSNGLSVPSPRPAMARACIDRAQKRLDWIFADTKVITDTQRTLTAALKAINFDS